jgi:hypothetical protein
MATANSKRSGKGHSSFEDHVGKMRQAGIGQIFAEGSQFGSTVLELHKGLLGGLARAQKRETERLAAKGQKDAGNRQAQSLGAQAEAIRENVNRIEDAARKLVGAVREKGVLQGYVFAEDGTAAAGHDVRISQTLARTGSSKLHAKTDETGYFRIILTGTKGRSGKWKAAPVAAQGAASVNDGIGESNEVTLATSPDTMVVTAKSHAMSVDIYDAKGKHVFHDPIPFVPEANEPGLRFYPLLGASFWQSEGTVS